MMREHFGFVLSISLSLTIATICAQEVTVQIRQAATVAPPQIAGPTGPQAPGTGLILGRVVDADSRQPVAGVTVQLSGGGAGPAEGFPGGPAQPSSLTNGDGYFVLRSLPPGSYTLSAAGPGYLNSTYGWRRPDGGPAMPVVLADGQRVLDVEIRMWKFGVIAGTVEDEFGDPVVGANIRALRREANGRLLVATTSATDDRGMYRLASLTPGEYLVVAPSAFSAVPGGVATALRGSDRQLLTQLSRDAPSLSMAAATGMRIGDMVASMSIMGMGGDMMAAPDAAGRLMGYATTFHPSATSTAGAAAVRVASGAERAGVNIELRSTRMFSVSGSVTGPDGPVANLGLRLTPLFTASLASDLFFDTANTATSVDGSFTFLGVPPGQYEVRALRMPTVQMRETMQTVTTGGGNTMTIVTMGMGDGVPPPVTDEPTYWARVPVDVGTRDVAGVSVTLTTGTRLSGQVVFDGGSPPAVADRRRLGITLAASDDRSTAALPAAPIAEDLSFRTAQYPAGRFLLNVGGVPAGWTAVEARVGAVNALVEPITPTGAEITGVVVTLSRRAPRITGTVRQTAARAVDATVVAFPADHRAWIEAGMPTRLVRTASVTANGAFDLSNLVPGSYALAAVASAEADTRSPSFFDTIARGATRVTVSLGEHSTQSLTVVPAR